MITKMSTKTADILMGGPFCYESAADSSRLERELQTELDGYLARLDGIIAADLPHQASDLQLVERVGVTRVAATTFPTVPDNPVLDWDVPALVWPDFDYTVPEA